MERIIYHTGANFMNFNLYDTFIFSWYISVYLLVLINFEQTQIP